MGGTADVIPISLWYPRLGQFSFPTVFIELNHEEVAAFLRGETESAPAAAVTGRIQQAIKALPGSAFVACDVCAPTDNEKFAKSPSVAYGRVAWRLLTTSDKVTAAFRDETTNRIVVRPYRRMNRTREFRLFFAGRQLKAMSQYNLDRHFARLAKQEKRLWRRMTRFAGDVGTFLPRQDLVMDVYLTSDDQVLIIDLNPWGPPTDPLLLKSWDQDWDKQHGVCLLPRPIKMKGEISVSF